MKNKLLVNSNTLDSEIKRILYLNECNVLNNNYEKIFDNLTKIISNIINAKIVYIGFLDKDNELIKSGIGIKDSTINKNLSLSFKYIDEENIKIIEINSDDNFFSQHLKMKICVCVPIFTYDNIKLGNIVILNDKKLKITDSHIDSLNNMSKQISEILELRKNINSSNQNKQFNLKNFENTDYLVAVVDKDFNCLNANNEFIKFFSILNSKSFEIKNNIREFLRSDIYHKWLSYFKKALSGEKFSVITSIENENYINYYDISFSPIIEKSLVSGVSIIGHQINKLKNLEDQMKKLKSENELNKSFLTSVVENTDFLGIAVFDTDSRFLMFNEEYKQGYYRKFGFYPKLGLTLEDFNNEGNEYKFWRDCYDRALNGEKFNISHQYKNNDNIYYIEIYFYPIFNNLKEIYGFYLIAIDSNRNNLNIRMNNKNYLIY